MDEKERDSEEPFPREPWQRLLEQGAGGPSETTDARIRASARRDLAPRGQRWWLPASLAASFVLAAVIVHSQLGSGGRLRITQTERGGSEAIDGRIVDRSEGEQAREPGESATAPSAQRSKQAEAAEPDAYGYADSELGQEAAGTGPRVGGPEHELQAASEMPEERVDLGLLARRDEDAANSAAAAPAPAAAPPPAVSPDAAGALRKEEDLGEITVTAAKRREAEAARQAAARQSAWTPPHVAAPVDNARPPPAGVIATPPTPEAWYAAIEKLRADGRTEEARRELERLKKAYPGWLERHLADPPP